MGIQDLLKEKREDILKLATKYGAANVRVCGSVARWRPQFRFILAIALGLFAGSMAGCAQKPEGFEFNRGLMLKEDGLVYRIGEDTPYTGKAYDSVCGHKCMPLIHWQGEFKDGKKHGTFVFPASRKPNALFASGDKHVVRVKFTDGIEIDRAR